jgi:dienelactone hydrolase
MRILCTLILFTLLASTSTSRAEVVAKTVEYKLESTTLEGSIVYDNASSGKKPGVLIVHEAGGNSPAARSRAAQVVKLGYVAFTADLYGKGVTPKDGKDALTKSGLNGKDRKQVRDRLTKAVEVFAKMPQVNGSISALGYGLGGTGVLELARSGAEIEGVVCLHGELNTPTPAEAKKVGASILVIVGADDPFIPLTQVTAFEEEMRKADADWQVLRMGGVVHDFTNPQAGRNLKSGSAYDEDADKRSQEAIKTFLVEMFPTAKEAPKVVAKKEVPLPKGIPEKVLKVLAHVDQNAEAIEGYEGGRNFGNFERLLPISDSNGKRIKYREWDVNPLKMGVNRGVERLVTGSDNSAYYTDDHYKSFKKIR